MVVSLFRHSNHRTVHSNRTKAGKRKRHGGNENNTKIGGESAAKKRGNKINNQFINSIFLRYFQVKD